MTIKDKLNEAHSTDKLMDAVFEFRAITENAYNVIQETVNRIDEIAGEANFVDVDAEIKETGVAIRQILKAAKEELDAYSEFLNWVQSTESE